MSRRRLLILFAGLALTACAHQQSSSVVTSPPPDPSIDAVSVAKRPAPGPSIDALAYDRPRPARPKTTCVKPCSTTVAVPVAAPAFAPVEHTTYTLDTGDKLRIVVFGQDALSNVYSVDAAGAVTMPLIGAVQARGLTTRGFAAAITAKLKQSFIRDPYVAVEVDTYRPFFVLGEVTYPGQYPYVPNMTVEAAVAIAGGFTPRAYKYNVTVTRKFSGLATRVKLPIQGAVHPGDTITVGERWF